MRILDSGRSAVVRVSFSPDGRLLLALTADGELMLWDWLAGQKVFRLSRCALAAQAVISPDARWLAAFAPDFRIHRSDQARPVISPFQGEPGWGRLVGGLAFAPDGQTLVATQYVHPFEGFITGRLLRWSTANWQPLPVFAVWPPFDRIAFDPTGQFLAGINPVLFQLRFAISGGLHAWASPHKDHPGQRTHLAFAPQQPLLAFGWDNDIHLLETQTGKLVAKLPSASGRCQDLAFIGDGLRLATVDADGSISLLALPEGIETARLGFSASVRSIACTPDGSVGAAGLADGTLILLDMD